MDNKDKDLKNALDDIFGSDFIEIDTGKKDDAKEEINEQYKPIEQDEVVNELILAKLKESILASKNISLDHDLSKENTNREYNRLKSDETTEEYYLSVKSVLDKYNISEENYLQLLYDYSYDIYVDSIFENWFVKESGLYKKPDNSSINFIYESANSQFELCPFKFIFQITYSLFQNTLSVDVNIKSDNDIYFSYGSHTGVKTNNLASLYINSNFQYYPLNNNGLIDNSNEKSLNLNKIPLNCKFFEKFDTFVFKNIDGIIKVDNGLNHIYTYKFDAPLVAIWGSKIYNNFTCIEPWWGISNYIDESKDITNRLYINKVNGEKRFHYEITFNKKQKTSSIF